MRKETDGYMTAEELKKAKPVRGISGAGVRTLNIPALGFEVVVMSDSQKTTDLIGQLLEKKIVEEISEDDEPKECKWCNQFGGHTCEPSDGAWVNPE
jgi:hypothetical protein